MSAKAARYIALRLLLSAVSVLLPAAGLEIYLRLKDPVAFRAPQPRREGDAWRELLHVRSPIPGLAYELAPHHKTFATGVPIATNAHGMRSFELLPRRDDIIRVAVVGDSYAFGFGVELHATFVAQVERQLNAGGPPGGVQYELLNYGVGGYSTRDEALVVEHKVLPRSPDLILLAYTLNDPEIDPIQPVHSYYQDVALWQHSHVLRLAALARFEWDIRRLGGGSYIRHLYRHPRKWHSVEVAFGRIAQLARAAGVPVGVVVFPHGQVLDWDDYPYREAHAQVMAAARAVGFTVLDLLPAFERGGAPLRLRLALRDDHPNGRGHALAARHITAWLREHLLASPESPASSQDGIAPPFL